MRKTKTKTNQQGFTLIELLIVIAIIGILASVVLVSLNSGRIKARDVRRKSDLHQIALALEDYYAGNGTYVVTGTGWNGSSAGWFNYQGGSYSLSIANGLKNLGYFSTPPRDPSISSDNQTPQYMKYQCGNGFYVYAKLENPSANDIATYTASKAAGCANLDAYNMNYALGHK